MTSKEYGINLGILIREAMKLENLTQERLSDELGVHRNTVQRWLKGINVPDAYELHRIQKLTKSQIEVYEDDEVFIETSKPAENPCIWCGQEVGHVTRECPKKPMYCCMRNAEGVAVQ